MPEDERLPVSLLRSWASAVINLPVKVAYFLVGGDFNAMVTPGVPFVSGHLTVPDSHLRRSLALELGLGKIGNSDRIFELAAAL